MSLSGLDLHKCRNRLPWTATGCPGMGCYCYWVLFRKSHRRTRGARGDSRRGAGGELCQTRILVLRLLSHSLKFMVMHHTGVLFSSDDNCVQKSVRSATLEKRAKRCTGASLAAPIPPRQHSRHRCGGSCAANAHHAA